MKALVCAVVLFCASPVFAQELPKDLQQKLEVFKLKAELHETKVALLKAEAERLMLLAQREGDSLRAEQARLEAEALKELKAPEGAKFDWATSKAERK